MTHPEDSLTVKGFLRRLWELTKLYLILMLLMLPVAAIVGVLGESCR